MSADSVTDVTTKPSTREYVLGATLSTVWAVLTIWGAGEAMASKGGSARVAVLAVGWLVGGAWWLALFFRRVGRSYRAGVDGT